MSAYWGSNGAIGRRPNTRCSRGSWLRPERLPSLATCFAASSSAKENPIIYWAGDFIDAYVVDGVERDDQSWIFVLEIDSGQVQRLLLWKTVGWKGGGRVMEEKEIQQRFHLLQQQVEAAVSLLEEVKLNCAAAADALKIEVEVLRRLMEGYDPDFARRYAELRAQLIQEVIPESMEPSRRRQT
jgi:hypothetical protein